MMDYENIEADFFENPLHHKHFDTMAHIKTNTNHKNKVKDTIENDAYLSSSRCPECMNKLFRNFEERTFYCEYCGTKLHQKAFTAEEINEALFQHEMDEYED